VRLVQSKERTSGPTTTMVVSSVPAALVPRIGSGARRERTYRLTRPLTGAQDLRYSRVQLARRGPSLVGRDGWRDDAPGCAVCQGRTGTTVRAER